MKLTNDQILQIAKESGYEYAAIKAVLEIESGGTGFASDTGKIIIQFEPSWFKKKAPYAPSGTWSVNKIDRQSKEWEAFNDAFAKNQNAAMESTSIGLPQIMGFHYKRLGFKTVGEMWNNFKESEYNQVKGLVKFIDTDPHLRRALILKDWHLFATNYNGSGYKALAKKIGREPYDISLKKAYAKYKS